MRFDGGKIVLFAVLVLFFTAGVTSEYQDQRYCQNAVKSMCAAAGNNSITVPPVCIEDSGDLVFNSSKLDSVSDKTIDCSEFDQDKFSRIMSDHYEKSFAEKYEGFFLLAIFLTPVFVTAHFIREYGRLKEFAESLIISAVYPISLWYLLHYAFLSFGNIGQKTVYIFMAFALWILPFLVIELLKQNQFLNDKRKHLIIYYSAQLPYTVLVYMAQDSLQPL